MDRQFPVGKFKFDANSTFQDVQEWIEIIRSLPQKLAKEMEGITEQQLETPYREGGWTVREVVHHIGDSHMNAMIRFKLSLTEENPTIKAYEQALWTGLGDYEDVSVADALELVRIIHAKWVAIIGRMKEEDFDKTFYHPEYKTTYSLKHAAAMYAWHSNHHLAHIQLVTQNK